MVSIVYIINRLSVYAVFEDRLNSSNVIIAKKETEVAGLREQLLNNAEELGKLKGEMRIATDRLSRSEANERRFKAELELVRRESRNSDLLLSTVQQLQSKVDRRDAERTHDLQATIDQISKERDSLQRALNQMGDTQQERLLDMKVLSSNEFPTS